jgi:hypothetical protein
MIAYFSVSSLTIIKSQPIIIRTSHNLPGGEINYNNRDIKSLLNSPNAGNTNHSDHIRFRNIKLTISVLDGIESL